MRGKGSAPTRRPETADDARFRLRLFQSTHGAIFAGLDPALAETLLRHQFAAQDVGYRAAFAGARFDIVECSGHAVGRIVTLQSDDATTLVDIALLPEWRGRGIGSALIAALLGEARAAGTRVRLSVARSNVRAQALYRRLGFRVVAADPLNEIMEWMDAPRLFPAVKTMPDRLQLPLHFDPAPMAAECAALAGAEWIRHFVPSNYDGEWDVIPLRGPAEAAHPVMSILSDPATRDYADTPFLDACPAIRAALGRLGCPVQSVRLMRLGPGSRIKEHRDHDLSFEDGFVRLHVPLITHPGVVFTLNGRRVVMEAGSCWYLRLSDPHAVENPGPAARVHLVVDAAVGPEIKALFAAALAEAA